MDRFVKVAGVFVSLDMPDPKTEWRGIAAAVGFAILLGVMLITALWAV